MANHTNNVYLVRYSKGEYVKGDAFYPDVTDKILDAARLDSPADAKKYVKTATARLKKKGFVNDLKVVKAEATRDENFQLVSVKEIES